MISEALICGEATFDAPGQLLSELRPVNYFFGSNGTGKSTIAKVLAAPDRYAACSITDAGEYEVLLFNEDFIRSTVRESSSMPGVFTIGDNAGEAVDRIAELEAERAALQVAVAAWRTKLVEKQQEKVVASDHLRESAWLAKKALGETLQAAFAGLNNSKEAFRDRLLKVEGFDSYSGPSLEALQAEALLVFKDPPPTLEEVPPVPFQSELERAWSGALAEPVLSSGTSQMSQLIADLGNADWVHTGLSHLDHSIDVCPFCQQKVPADLSHQIRALFDDRYERSVAQIQGARESYRGATGEILSAAGRLMDSGHPVVNQVAIAPLVERLRSDIAANLPRFDEKISMPSKVIEYAPLAPAIIALRSLVELWNDSIAENNKLASEFAKRRAELVRAAWTFVASVDARPLVNQYRTTATNSDAAIANLDTKIAQAVDTLTQKLTEIKDLRKKLTSSLPTATALNDTLLAFGFDTFSVDLSDDGSTYRLARPDGASASLSLSEGERNFIAFLYFYHLASGTLDADSAPLPRVVVIDDPVSSLDSQSLFVVSALVRRLVTRAESPGDHGLRQIFVLTHNAYFHREVTFDNSRRVGSKNTERFWVVRRTGRKSVIEPRDSNPVSTGYELLWDEVRHPSSTSTGVANAMRRILEYYFQILGGEKLQGLDQRFKGTDQLVCSALLSWANQGSHIPADDMFVAADTYESEQYQQVFRKVFEESGHEAHYKMMMKVDVDK